MILVAGRWAGKPLSAVISCVFMTGIKALIKVVRTAKGAPCFAKITPPSPPNSYLLPLDI
jgi:hypothetical protein